MLAALMRERDEEKRRADKHEQRAEEQSKRANDLHVENLRLQLELDRYQASGTTVLAPIVCNRLVTWHRCF